MYWIYTMKMSTVREPLLHTVLRHYPSICPHPNHMVSPALALADGCVTFCRLRCAKAAGSSLQIQRLDSVENITVGVCTLVLCVSLGKDESTFTFLDSYHNAGRTRRGLKHPSSPMSPTLRLSDKSETASHFGRLAFQFPSHFDVRV